MTPFERDPEIEAALRASLEAHARQAPPGDALAEQIIAGVGTSRPAPAVRRSWGRFTLPAAAAILAAIAGIAVSIVAANPGGRRTPPVAETTTRPVPTVTVTRTPTTADTTPSTTTSSDTSSLHQVEIADLTFTGTDDGWALASARCIDDPGRRCTAIMRSTDGTSWTSHPGDSPFDAPGVDDGAPQVSHIRFANDRIGYVYGPDAVFMTTDGGATWQRQKGLGADALETLNDSVLLVRVSDTACPDRCPLTLRAAIGSSTWTSFRLPEAAPNDNAAVTLSRAGHLAVLDVSTVNLEKGTTGVGRVYRSGDDGNTWHRVSAPCPALGSGYADDPQLASVAADGITVGIACSGRGRDGTTRGSTVTSSDGGQHFVAPSDGGRLRPADLLAVPDATTQLVVAGGLYRSADTGNTWSRVTAVTGSVSFLGFENSRVGRAVADNAIWTTRNGGQTWTKVALP